MKYFLDTNTCIYFLKGKYPQLAERLKSKSPDDIKIPSVVAAELFYGAEKSSNKKKSLEVVENFLFPFEILEFGGTEMRVYGSIRAKLEAKGMVIGPNDLLIASIVLSSGGKLITNNVGEFKRVPSLKVENWV